MSVESIFTLNIADGFVYSLFRKHTTCSSHRSPDCRNSRYLPGEKAGSLADRIEKVLREKFDEGK